MKLYSEDKCENLLRDKRTEIKTKIENENEDYLLNVGVTQYIAHLKDKFLLDFPILYEDKIFIETYEKLISVNELPSEVKNSSTKPYVKKDVIVYNVPYKGSIDLLKFQPSSWINPIDFYVKINRDSKTIRIEFVNFNDDSEIIKNKFKESKKQIFDLYGSLKQEIETYNSELENYVASIINLRRKKILKKMDFLSSLGVPISKKENIPETFAIPKPQLRDKITVKPVVYKAGFKPEPTLDDENYQKILKIINDVGKNFERMPSIYLNKGEEDLRDHIVMNLDPNFECGSATGETFNKKGKTDILLKYDSSVVFVAECKFWDGDKKFIQTIDQLLSYLTWRDSKTSVIVFVQKKEIIQILNKINEVTKSHKNYIKELGKSEESWFNYIFSLPDDINKEIKLAIQLFHLPK